MHLSWASVPAGRDAGKRAGALYVGHRERCADQLAGSNAEAPRFGSVNPPLDAATVIANKLVGRAFSVNRLFVLD
jgi:hypothetical protein